MFFFREPTDKRMFVVAAALNDGYSIDKLYDLTKVIIDYNSYSIHILYNITKVIIYYNSYSHKLYDLETVLLHHIQKSVLSYLLISTLSNVHQCICSFPTF